MSVLMRVYYDARGNIYNVIFVFHVIGYSHVGSVSRKNAVGQL